MKTKDAKEKQKGRSPLGRSRPSRWLKGDIITAILLCISVGAAAAMVGSCESSVVVDCYWDAKVFTWIDINADGIFQEGEPPLPGVNILIDDERSHVTNSVGEIQFGGGFYGCPQTGYKVTTEEPTGYRLTTAGTQFVRESGGDQSLQFGFTYLPEVPTLTPGPKHQLSCTTDARFMGQPVYAIASDKDGLWVASSLKVARLDFSTNAWKVYYAGEPDYGSPFGIFVGPDESVWMIAGSEYHPSRTIFRLNQETWEGFWPEEIGSKPIESINWAPDGRLWFSTSDQGIKIWDPHTNIWTSDASVTSVQEVLFASAGKYLKIQDSGGGAIAPDGKVWGVSKSGTSSWEGDFYDPVTQKVTESPTFYGCYSDMKFDQQGGMWLATCNDGLLYIPDPIKGSQAGWHEYHQDIGFASDETNALSFQGDDILWVGTREGLARCQIETH
jgi:streptogramin lyase